MSSLAVCSCFYNLFSSTESDFSVQVAIVVTDFSDGPSVYDNIRKQLDEKDIGILGDYTLIILSVALLTATVLEITWFKLPIFTLICLILAKL